MDLMAPMEKPEDRSWPWVKRRRVSGQLGEGWEKISPEKVADMKSHEVQRLQKVDTASEVKKPQCFMDLQRRQELISRFVVALKKQEEKLEEIEMIEEI